MHYQYAIKKLEPKQEFMSVVYSSEGYPDYNKNFWVIQFDEQHLKKIIEESAQVAVSFWDRWSKHPEAVALTATTVKAEYVPHVAPEIVGAELAEIEREDRNRHLANTDWWVLPDTPEPTQSQLDYRQALRDVPQQAGFPEHIEWPTL